MTTTWPDITDNSTPEEVTAVRVAMKLEGYSGYLDNPVTQEREWWRAGTVEDRFPRKDIMSTSPHAAWMMPCNPDPGSR